MAPTSTTRAGVCRSSRFTADRASSPNRRLALLARVSNREMAALGPASREQVRAVRSHSERLFLDVIDRGTRLGVFDVAHPWLGLAAIGGMGIRVAEWWDESMGLGVEQVVAAYAGFAVRILTSGPPAG